MRGLRLAAAWCGAVAWRVVGEARDLGAPSGCRSPGASYRTVKLWQLRVPSSGSSTLVHLLKHLAGESSSDCVAHGRCERVARDGGGGACGRLRFASPKAHNPGHHHFGLFEGAVGTNFAALATTTVRHPALWIQSTRKHWRSHETNWFAWAHESFTQAESRGRHSPPPPSSTALARPLDVARALRACGTDGLPAAHDHK